MSVKAHVDSLVSDARNPFIKNPILEATDPTPSVKTAVGISYIVLSDMLTHLAEEAQRNGGLPPYSLVSKLLDALYQAPRLMQWQRLDSAGVQEFRLYTSNDAIFVSVIKEKITLTKGIRVFPISAGLPTAALFAAIQQAQEVVQPAINKAAMTDEEQEEYFADDPTADGADIDSALADPEQVSYNPFGRDSRPTERDDTELMEEALNEDQRTTDGEPTVTVSQQFIAEPKAKYAERMNRNSETDAAQVNIQYKDRDPLAQEPQIAVTRVLAHLKSLQGNVLNIVEAAIADKEQRKAVKTLINKTFRNKMNNLGGGWSSDEE